ncbi:PEP-CTERM sorting domain-containing protein [Roseateles cellulosilyticus]|uniref:Ice-binding protein C-terminal domain-containing protein n=1 Tax=Pelomonas cellulosilytica TaxID=2906762 RepID=A0ABS8XQ74_9BURK|nr:PEP-CTERM sorting domain-containing protein [Pelomonas sp. P8]MCE4553792.1 hypothetical protein [Pelomonas sp. P8]
MNQKILSAMAAALLSAGAAQAAIVNLTYTGESRWETGVAVTGSGQFVTKTGVDTGDIGRDDLASFNFTFSYSFKGKVDTFSFGLADLTCAPTPFGTCGFSATLTDTGVDALALQTDYADAVNTPWGQNLHVRSLDEVYTTAIDLPAMSAGVMSAQLVQGPTPTLPEPASLALASLALGAVAFASRRRAR